jgi:hypothetical protein
MMKDISDPMNTNVFGFCEMILDDESVKVNQTELSSSLKWSAIKRLDETPEYFFLYVTANSAYSIPKEKISAEEVKELDELFKKHLPERNVFK